MRLPQIAVLASLLLFPFVAGAATGPMATLKQKNSEVDRLLRQKVTAGSAEEKKQKADIKTLAGGLLDYDELAHRSLAANWDKLTGAQRSEFVATLREIIERNYVRQLRTNMDYQVVYKGEEVAGAEATVITVVKVKTTGKATDAEIVYKMKQAGTSPWLVYDVITDEVSLVRNYKAQFGKAINERGYDDLIKKMKAKLVEPAQN